MTELIEWLLDLENIRLGRDAPLLVKWGADVPGWMLLGFALAGLVWISLVYRRERAPLGRRVILAALRAATFALVVAVLCQPSLVLERNRVEPSHVTLLVDTSQSMSTRDFYLDDKLAKAVARGASLKDTALLTDYSRLELVIAALLRDEAAALFTLLDRNGIQLCTFTGALETEGFAVSRDTLPVIAERLEDLRPDGRSTDLAGALSRAIENAHGRRLAAIVLATDGQTTEPTSLKDALALARGRQVPVFPVRFGSTERPRDIDVGPIRAEESVFVNDIALVEAQITATGIADPTPVAVRLIDDRTGETLALREFLVDPTRTTSRGGTSATRVQPARTNRLPTTSTVELRFKPKKTGRFRYCVEVQPLPNERTTANNVGHVDMTVLDDQLYVLYVEGYPRYEYRYLKNALLREETMEPSVLLIEADKRFVQEGADPIRRFPETPEELSRYDVVLFGDVDPRGGWLTEAQMKMLLDFVGNEGGGFGLIAGERFTPHRFLGTPLEKLIPVRIDPAFLGHYDTPLTTGFSLKLTSEGRRSRVFRFVDTDGSTYEPAARAFPVSQDADAPIPDSVERPDPFDALPELYWLARTLGPKPGASVLAQHPTTRTLSGPMPVVVIGRYGAGKIFFQATDDTWRWRRHTGELLHDTYWVQVARELMLGGRVSQDRRFVIRTDRRVYTFGSPIQTQVEIFDSQLLALHRDTIGMVVTEQANPPASPLTKGGQRGGPAFAMGEDRREEPPSDDAAAEQSDRLGSRSHITARFDLHRISPDSSLFEGTYVPPRAGTFALSAEDIAPRPGEPRGAGTSVFVRVGRPDLEARRPEANHEVLERIAEATGGRVVELDQLETEFGAIRDRSVQIPDDITEPLWDSRLTLILFGLMISVEWIMRKAFGLL